MSCCFDKECMNSQFENCSLDKKSLNSANTAYLLTVPPATASLPSISGKKTKIMHNKGAKLGLVLRKYKLKMRKIVEEQNIKEISPKDLILPSVNISEDESQE